MQRAWKRLHARGGWETPAHDRPIVGSGAQGLDQSLYSRVYNALMAFGFDRTFGWHD